MITALDHIAIAVPDLERAIERFAKDFGLSFEGREDVAAARTSTAFFPVPATSIELVHPLNGEGAIAGYLEKKGTKFWLNTSSWPDIGAWSAQRW